jgi:hypothetical protein
MVARNQCATSERFGTMHIFQFLCFLGCLVGFSAHAQVTVATEDFSTTTNISPNVGALGSGTNSSVCGNNDIFGISANHPTPSNLTTTGCGVTGYTGSFFGAMDVDACGGNTSTVKSISLLSYTVPNNNEVTFSGDFAVLGSSNSSSHNAVIAISFDGGATFPTTLFTFTGNTTTTYSCSCGGSISKVFSTKTVSVGSNLAGQNLLIKVTFTGMSGNDRGVALDEFKFLETVPACNLPTVQASSLTFPSVGASSTGLSWTNGNGDKVLVVARASTSTLTDPIDGLTYTANASFGLGTQIGTGNYVVYNGTGTSFTVTGIENSTNYTYSVYAFNSTGNCYKTVALSGNQTTTACSNPTVSPTSLSFSSVLANSMTLSWLNGNGDKVLVVARISGASLTDPSSGTIYTASPAFGTGTQIGTGNYVVYNGTGTSVGVNALTSNTNYIFSVYAYHASSCYFLTSLVGNQTTAHNKFYVNDGSPSGDIYTSAIGSAGGTGTSANPFGEVTSALAVAQAGDTIYVDAGTWVYSAASSYTNPHNVTVSMEGLAILGAGIGVTIFDDAMGANENYWLKIAASNVLVKDLTVTRFNSTGEGHALLIGDGVGTYSGIVIENVEIFNNGASSGSVGDYSKAVAILSHTSSIFFGGGSVCNQPSNYNGAIWVKGTDISTTFNYYSFVGNTGDGIGGYDGGGLVLSHGDGTQVVTINNSIFQDNQQTSADFNAMDIKMITGILNVDYCLFNNSRSKISAGTHIGGAIEITGGTATFNRSKFMNHSSSTGNLKGAAVGNNGGNVTITNCFFSGNSGSGADDIHNESGTTTVSNTTLSEIGHGGGTFTLVDSGNPTVVAGTVTKTNTNAPSAFTNPSTPSYGGLCALTAFVALPIDLLYFKAKKVSNEWVDISWSTSTEWNNDYFTILKSVDGKNWDPICYAKGSLKSQEKLVYQHTDRGVMDEVVYYKLRQVDTDGRVFEFGPVSVRFEKNKGSFYYVNMMGQIIDNKDVSSGFYLKCFQDGSAVKVFRE